MVEIDEAKFLDMYTAGFGALKGDQKDGLLSLVRSIGKDPKLNDRRWPAYMLATVKHECADTWRPIEEYGKGAGRPYPPYYGRGYVQLTWKENYLKLGQALGLGDQMVVRPELALQPDVAYQVMSFGMRSGTFTGKKMVDFLHDNVTDFINARRIINGLDRAELIGGYASKFNDILSACSRVTSGS
jgi:hypothetical protein